MDNIVCMTAWIQFISRILILLITLTPLHSNRNAAERMEIGLIMMRRQFWFEKKNSKQVQFITETNQNNFKTNTMKTLFIAACLLSCTALFAQAPEKVQKDNSKSNEKIFTVVEEMP